MTLTALKHWLEPVRKNGILDVATAVAKGRVVAIDDGGTPVRWLITNRNDEIQRSQIEQGFYERAELEQLRADVGERRVILDIGANIGNHAVYFSRHFNSKRIILVEPYQPAVEHLLANIALNYRGIFDLQHLGKAVGARPGTGSIVAPTEFNIGLTRIDVQDDGNIQVLPGDHLTRDVAVDLIKIDVEGMELDVLEGLSETLTKQRPALYVEIQDSNREQFLALMERAAYRMLREVRAYDTQSNFTMLPAA